MFRLHLPLRSGSLFAVVGAVALIAVACGGDDDAPSDVSSAVAGNAPAATASQIPTAAPSAAAPSTAAVATFSGAGDVSGSGAYDWRITRVDEGTKPDLVLVDGSPRVAYMLERQGAAGFVRVASFDGDQFAAETLQDGYLYGPLDIEAGPGGVLAVAYHNHDWEDAAVAVLDGDAWRIDRVADRGHDGWDTALAFDATGGLHLLAIDPSQFGAGESVEYASLADGVWGVQPVGSGPQPYEWGTDIAVASDGTLHAVYFDAVSSDLIYATSDGAGWTLASIYESGDAGRFAVIALDDDGLPSVAFVQSDETLNEQGANRASIVYGAFDGTAWSFEVLTTLDNMVLGFEGARRTVALEIGALGPVLAFIDESVVGVATLVDGSWTVERVLQAGSDPFQIVGLALDGDGAPHLTFSTITATGPLAGEVWYVEPLPKP